MGGAFSSIGETMLPQCLQIRHCVCVCVCVCNRVGVIVCGCEGGRDEKIQDEQNAKLKKVVTCTQH